MRTLFDAYLMVDWSAASKPTTGKNSIWIGALIRDARLKLKYQAINPPTRLAAQNLIVQLIERLRARGDRIILGVDFPLGYPAGTARALGLTQETDPEPPWLQMHAHIASKVKYKADNMNARFAIAAGLNYAISGGAGPFWGVVPAKDAVSTLSTTKPDYDQQTLPEWRICERYMLDRKMAQPSSVWQLAYVGSVGSQTLLGIPLISHLRERINGSRVWPFEQTDVESDDRVWGDETLLITEIYPSLLDIKTRSTDIVDEKQVHAMCWHVAEQDKRGELGDLLNVPGRYAQEYNNRAPIDEEGWILGLS